jgi:hypothetical protein
MRIATTQRAKDAAEETASILRDQGFKLACPEDVWRPGKDGLKPRLRIGTWQILKTKYGLSLPQISKEASPVNPETGKKFHHTTVLSGLRRYEHYFGEAA